MKQSVALKGYMRRDQLLGLLAKLKGRKVADRTLRNWEQKGKAPRRVKVGHLVVYRVADVNAWLDSNIVGHGA